MIYMGFVLVLAFANELHVPAGAWVLFGIQCFIETFTFVASMMARKG